MPLNDMQIRRVYTLGDGQWSLLLIEPNGSKSWRFRYRFAGKTKNDLACGLPDDHSRRCPFPS